MSNILSIFVDESGDFGEFSAASPYYMVSMIFHEQNIDITDDIAILDRHVRELGFPPHAVHVGPLIRRESIYERYNDQASRMSLLNAMYHFTRKLNIRYICPFVRKVEGQAYEKLCANLYQEIYTNLSNNKDYLSSFDKVIIYYDNGQHELSKILQKAFKSLFSNVEFRRVAPSDYKLFQVADLICTWELLALKASEGKFTKSERDFFGSTSKFLKNRYKLIFKKKL